MPDALDRLAPMPDSGPLGSLTVGELRERRNELQRSEQTLSYLRRLVQGRLDIVVDEQHRRAEGAVARDLSTLVDDLPKILADHTSGGGRGALPEVTVPTEDLDSFLGEMDHIVSASGLAELPSLAEAELAAIVEGLGGLERDVSQRRRAMHGAIDGLQDEIVRRYKTGEASVDALIP